MQQSASIRSLSARDSRKELVTVRRRRLRSSTATTRAFPQTLSTKISAYSRTRTVRSSSAGARSQAAQRARERLRVPALRCARELLRPSLRRTRCQDAVPGRGATRAELQHGDSGRAAGTRCCRSPRPNPACPESRSSLGRARGRRHRERSGPARASPGAGIRVRGQRDVALERGDPWGSRASLPPRLGTLAAPAQSEPTPGPPCAEHRAMLGTRRTGRERLLCGAPRCAPSRPVPSRPARSALTFGRRRPPEAPAEEVAGGAVPGGAGPGAVGGAATVPGAAEQLLQGLVQSPRVHGGALRAAPRPSRPPRQHRGRHRGAPPGPLRSAPPRAFRSHRESERGAAPAEGSGAGRGRGRRGEVEEDRRGRGRRGRTGAGSGAEVRGTRGGLSFPPRRSPPPLPAAFPRARAAAARRSPPLFAQPPHSVCCSWAAPSRGRAGVPRGCEAAPSAAASEAAGIPASPRSLPFPEPSLSSSHLVPVPFLSCLSHPLAHPLPHPCPILTLGHLWFSPLFPAPSLSRFLFPPPPVPPDPIPIPVAVPIPIRVPHLFQPRLHPFLYLSPFLSYLYHYLCPCSEPILVPSLSFPVPIPIPSPPWAVLPLCPLSLPILVLLLFLLPSLSPAVPSLSLSKSLFLFPSPFLFQHSSCPHPHPSHLPPCHF